MTDAAQVLKLGATQESRPKRGLSYHTDPSEVAPWTSIRGSTAVLPGSSSNMPLFGPLPHRPRSHSYWNGACQPAS